MNMVNITINGCHVQVKAGSSVLQAAREANIDIPTLCQHPALINIGACRMCLVEVAKLPTLQPACTYPVAEGLEVQTETPRVSQMRKFVLEMLFSERNHYCMYCEMSGDCELQALAYKYGLDHWTYPSPNKSFAVDGSRQFFIMDHNRCILCRRCVRACADLAANHTLGLKNRGAKTMVCADMDATFGESTCIECGTCLQVCPTGALVDRKSAYMGRNVQVERTPSACAACAVGCQTQVVTRAGHPLRVEGEWGGTNGGVMCKKGRFDPIFDDRPRVAAPLARQEGELKETTLEKALQLIAAPMRASGGKGVNAWASAGLTSEVLTAFTSAFALSGAAAGVLEQAPAAAAALATDGVLGDLDKADLILVAGADPLAVAPVLGYRIKRSFFRKTQIIVASDGANGLDEFSTRKLALAQLGEAIAAAQAAAYPVLVAGAELSAAQAQALAALKGKARILVLQPAANSVEAQTLGLKGGVDGAKSALAFVLAGEAELSPEQIARLRQADCLAVQSGVHNALTAVADVVLPAPLWFERTGTFTNLEGRKLELKPSAPPPAGILGETEILERLVAQL